jgi:hypothetical protein
MRINAHFGELPLGAFEHCGDGRIKPQGGGGIPIISDVVEVVGDVVSDVVDVAADVINDIPIIGEIADDQLGIDPNGGGLIPELKAAGTIAATSWLGGQALGALGSAFEGASALADGVQIFDDGSQLITQGGKIIGGLDTAGEAFNVIDGVAQYAGGAPLAGAAELNFGGGLADLADVEALTNYNAGLGAADGLNITAKDVSNASKVLNAGEQPSGGSTLKNVAGAVTGALGGGGAGKASGSSLGNNLNSILGMASLANQGNQASTTPINYAPINLFGGSK